MDSDGFSQAPQPGRVEADVSPLGVRPWVWALAALLCAILASFLFAGLQQRNAEQVARQNLEALGSATAKAIADQLEMAELVARSVQATFLASEEVDAGEFEIVYASLRPRDRFSSLQALAYAERRPAAGVNEWRTTLVQPVEGNARLFGLDVAAQPENLQALLASRDTDSAVLSPPFALVQGPGASGRSDGVALRLPIYTSGPPPRTVEERRARMAGSLAISFRPAPMIAGVLPTDAHPEMRVSVTDVTGGGSFVLYDTHAGSVPAGMQTGISRDFTHGGRTWRVSLQPTGAAMAPDWSDSSFWPGLVASVLLALLVWSVLTSRRRALEIAVRMSRSYRESEERFRALNELLPALVLLARDGDGAITYANQAARLKLGEDSREGDLYALFDDAAIGRRLRDPGLQSTTVEARLHGAGGERFWSNASVARVVVEGQPMLLMVATDISEQRQLTEMLGYQASHDALTELLNRHEFERRVKQVLASGEGARGAALLYLDMDQFKLVNDTSGHIAGDQLLVQLAGILREQVNEQEVLLARLGGDEFGILALDTGGEDAARRLAERLRAYIDGYVFVWGERSYVVSASIGGVMLDGSDTTFRDLLAHADTACYMAKEGGRNRIHFYSASDDQTARRYSEMEWANRLKSAVAEQRLLLEYQEVWPLNGKPGQAPYVELLLRLRDEDGHLVLPGAFMPAAERYGLMPMIDRWVIETALSNFDNLHPSGAALPLATINLSGASIEDASLADRILELLAEHRVDPRRVCFEITETVAVRNFSQVRSFIGRLREAGCRLALDDFGAGMSSFGYLKNLQVDIIKIDGSFIHDMLGDPMSLAIVRAVADIGHQRGLQVVAEWVSSEEIRQALVEIGVDYAQGFFLHRPEPVPFLRERR
ncbi:bifunctional diguanylate cyclase/phosphodiesterase [Novilysobacter spongiicola]|uniref:Diguanylate cyclase (GGDEF) domain-containing protein n=1 Tax=Lysobacter spongiicola DSM 21749 TaxID=1122188 RepID=A0A1T4RP18_9GAMM|nr:EAL domain-containing protein [Lysobacter spongiicola]SKA17719.1 diguanylate cyclase (GGDEF) domain-containing protein [Lysobacter spongiicola DSM 21749]